MTRQADEVPTAPAEDLPEGPMRSGSSLWHTALVLSFRGTRRFLGVTVALLIMMVFLTIKEDAFLTSTNQTNILRSVAVLFMVSIGNTYVLLTAGFDLSVGSMLSLGGVALAAFLGESIDPWLAIVLTLMFCTLIGGLLNGVLIGKAGLSFFVVTLASLSLFRGAVFVHTEGKTNASPTTSWRRSATARWAVSRCRSC